MEPNSKYFELYRTEMQKKFNASDYALQIMWRHLPYKKKLPFIKQAERKLNHDREKGNRR